MAVAKKAASPTPAEPDVEETEEEAEEPTEGEKYVRGVVRSEVKAALLEFLEEKKPVSDTRKAPSKVEDFFSSLFGG
jgi:hypothetical protein